MFSMACASALSHVGLFDELDILSEQVHKIPNCITFCKTAEHALCFQDVMQHLSGGKHEDSKHEKNILDAREYQV